MPAQPSFSDDLDRDVAVTTTIVDGREVIVPMVALADADPPEPVASVFNAVGRSPIFRPVAGKAFNITLWGGNANVRLERTFNDGTTWHPLTADGNALMSFSGPVSEQWSEPQAGVGYCLNCTTAPSSPVNYLLSQ